MRLSLRPMCTIVPFLCYAHAVRACPVCNTGTGQQVRAGIFDGHFTSNLLLTALPFPLFLGIAALLHFGLPGKPRWIRRHTPLPRSTPGERTLTTHAPATSSAPNT